MLPNKIIFITKLKNQFIGGNYLGWRIASIVVIGAMLTSALASAWFIYYNIYTTIANTTAITILGSTQYIDAVNTEEFEKAHALLQTKSITTVWTKNLRNIFEYTDIATTSTAYEIKH